VVLSYVGWRNRASQTSSDGIVAWLVPGFFHLYFGSCFFILGFYQENKWMTLAACLNLLLGLIIHLGLKRRKKEALVGT
jgi:hypothetical protein